MPEWRIERGIGETRAALVEDGEIVEARIELDGAMPAGSVIETRLVNAGSNGRNAVARDDSDVEYLLPRGASGVTEGARVNIEVTREAIPGGEPWKRPLARLTDEPPREAPSIAGRELRFPGACDELGDWSELLEEARSGTVRFEGGELR
ncbi:MAG TPA: ribonuclease, partial [Sphingomicrobium sp.]